MTDLTEMWERLEAHQPYADEQGYGKAWAKMCDERNQSVALAAAAAAKLAADEAAAEALETEDWAVWDAAREARYVASAAAKMAAWAASAAERGVATWLDWAQAVIEYINKAEGK